MTIMYYVTDHQNKPVKRRSVFLENAYEDAPAKSPPLRFTNKISSSDLNQHSVSTNKYPNGVIYETLKPLYLLTRALGIFPVANIRVGVFEATSPWIGYSIGVFLLVSIYIAYIQWDKVMIYRSQEGRFEEEVIDYLFTIYLLPIVVNPIIWFEANKLAHIVNDWVVFEKTYIKVCKKRLDFFLGNKSWFITIMLPILGCAVMVITHLTMAHFRFIQVIPYCYINTIIYLVGGIWYLQCDVVEKVSILFADDFQNALRNVGPSAQIADYRSLWVFLSKLIRDIGNAAGFTVTFLCLYLFLIVTLTIYGLLSQLQEGFGQKDIGLTITALFAVAFLFFTCDAAHCASKSVQSSFQKKLLIVELSWLNDDVQQEINMFLRATEMSSTNMSVVGFFDVNRNLFKALLATMVTYLVVLLQFQISIPSDAAINEINGTFKRDSDGIMAVAVTTLAPKQL